MQKYNFKIVLFIVIISLLGISYYSFFNYNTSTVSIKNNIFKTEVVQSAEETALGLSGRDSIANDHAMLFIFSDKKVRSFWMKDMNFDIDLLWIDNDKVIGYEQNMLAPDKNTAIDKLLKYNSLQPVDKVLEIKAGLIESLDIKIGDTININI